MLDYSNSLYHTKPSSYNSNTKYESGVREPVNIPDLSKEPLESYLCGLKPEAPFETITVLGLNFDKRIVSSDFSYASVQALGRPAKEKMIVRLLPDKLVSLIKKRASELEIEIPAKQESDATIPAFKVKVSDYIILDKLNKPIEKSIEEEKTDGEKTEKGKRQK